MHIDLDHIEAELVSVALDLATAAGSAALPHFRAESLVPDNKDTAGGFDPVTIGDREAEAAMREILLRRRPMDAVLGEETGASDGTSGLTWVLDPIDGTRAFIAGVPMWGVLVALNAGAAPVLGLIDQPYIGECFMGAFGRATLKRGSDAPVPIKTRRCADLSAATLFTTFPEVGTPVEGAAFAQVSRRVRLTRYGADCYAYAMVAMGQVDLVIESGLQPYDIQGPMAVVQAAGGIVTNWKGGPAHLGGRVIAAGDARVHAQALEILRKLD